MRGFKYVVGASLFIGGAGFAQPLQFEVLRGVPGVDGAPFMFAMSNDGSTIVGEVGLPPRALVWRNGVASSPLLWPLRSVSDDGSILMGYTTSGIFRFGPAVGLSWLTYTSEFQGRPYDMSSSGNVIVGYGGAGTSTPRPFRWTPFGGLQYPQTPVGSLDSAVAVSADGLTLVGQGNNGSGPRGYRWTEAMGPIFTSASAECTDVSGDGSVVTGYGSPRGYAEAFIWPRNQPLQFLGRPPCAEDSRAWRISSDGGTIGGEGWVWSARSGWRSISGLAVAGGVDLGLDVPGDVSGISSDGRVIAGTGQPTGSPGNVFVWRMELTDSLPCAADLDNGTGLGIADFGVDINDLLYFLVRFEAGNCRADLDDGSGKATPDGGVDINDLLFFLVRFEAGC